MCPDRTGPIETIEIGFEYPPVRTEVVILLRSWNGRQDVKRSHIGRQTDEFFEMIGDAFRGVFGKTDDVGKVTDDSGLAAKSDDVAIQPGMILSLVRRQQDFSVKRFHADKHLKATRSTQQINKGVLLRDLNVALYKERQADPLIDHGLQQRRRISIFVEVVGRKHDGLHTRLLRQSKAGQRRLNVLGPDSPSCDQNYRTKIASEWASAGRIDSQHGHDVTSHVIARWWRDDRRIEFLLPSMIRAVDRLELPIERIAKDGSPYGLCFGKGEADPTAVQHRRVASHGMGSADHAVLNALLQRIGGKIQAAMKLVRLNSGQRQKCGFLRTLELLEVRKLGLHILVDHVYFDRRAIELRRRHAAQVRNGGIRHESTTESLDLTIFTVFARLQNQDSKLSHGFNPKVCMWPLHYAHSSREQRNGEGEQWTFNGALS